MTVGLAKQVVKEDGSACVLALVSGALECGCSKSQQGSLTSSSVGSSSGNDYGALCECPAKSIMLVWTYVIDLAFI